MAIDPATASGVAASAARPVPPPAMAAGSASASASGGRVATAWEQSAEGWGGESAGTSNQNQDMSFWDFVDVINPLQHIPLVNRAYRALTGDEIKPSAQVMGDILYGGPLGGLVSVVNASIEQSTGKDMTGHALATVGLGDSESPTQLVNAAPPLAPAATAPQNTPRQPRPVDPNRAPAAAPAQAATQPPAPAIPVPAIMATPAAAGMPSGMPAGVPSGPASGAMRASSGPPVDPNALISSGYHPSKMPVRDAMLVTSMPKGSQTSETLAQRMERRPPAVALPAVPGSAAANRNQATANSNPAPQSQEVPRDAIADTMMRNLAKYRTVKQAPGTGTGTLVNTAS